MHNELLNIAQNIGSLLSKLRGDASIKGHWEGSQLKSSADIWAHEEWSRSLEKSFPGIAIVSEEDKISANIDETARYFLIDPIDGTASFAAGFDGFVTQIAYIESGVVQESVVHAPILNLTWHASLGKGSFLGAARLYNDIDKSGRLLLIDNYPQARGIAKTLCQELPTTGYLESGSIGLKLCRVADGSADLFVKDVSVRSWDVAPASLILSERGGIMLDIHGKSIKYGGGFEIDGLIAATDPSLVSRVNGILSRKTSMATKR